MIWTSWLFQHFGDDWNECTFSEKKTEKNRRKGKRDQFDDFNDHRLSTVNDSRGLSEHSRRSLGRADRISYVIDCNAQSIWLFQQKEEFSIPFLRVEKRGKVRREVRSRSKLVDVTDFAV